MYFSSCFSISRATGLLRGSNSLCLNGRPIRRVAWCTGGAQGHFEAAIAAGADAYLTGEISEPQAHYARESGVAFLACLNGLQPQFVMLGGLERARNNIVID